LAKLDHIRFVVNQQNFLCGHGCRSFRQARLGYAMEPSQ
jgi:hypothetical protein